MRSRSNRNTIPTFASRDREKKPRETSGKIFSATTEIRTQHLPNTRIQRYYKTSLSGEVDLMDGTYSLPASLVTYRSCPVDLFKIPWR